MRETMTTTPPDTEPHAHTRLGPLPEPTPQGVREQPRPATAVRAYLTFAALYAAVFGLPLLGVLASYLAEGQAPVVPAPDAGTFWSMALPQWITHLVLVVIALGGVWAVAHRRGVSLGTGVGLAPAWARQGDRDQRRRWRRQGWLVFAWTLAAYLAWLVLGTALAALTPAGLAGGFEITTRTEAVWTAAMVAPTLVTTAITEEVVIPAALVLLLGAARRPIWEVYTVAAVGVVAYHAYYGLPALALVPAALMTVWLYHRTGRLTPIILGHLAYNLGFSALIVAAPGTA